MRVPAEPAWGPPWFAAAGTRRGGALPFLRVAALVLVALVQVGGSFGAAHAQPHRRQLDALAVVLLLAGPAALGLLRRHPRLRCVCVAAVTALYLAAGYPYGPVFISMAAALVLTVVRGERLTAWGSAALLLLAPWSWTVRAAVLAWVVVVLTLAEVARVRSERAAGFREAARERHRRQAGEERLRIAQELHDVVAHHLSLINVQAGVALHLADRRPENVEPALRAIKEASKEALTELRSLVDVLRDDTPAPRVPAATIASIDDIVERAAPAGLVVTKVIEGQVRSLPAAVELAAYRVVQEAITNVVRHAGASRARVVITYGDRLSVRVEDDGRTGAQPATLSPGNGLRGMHERASALGGDLAVATSVMGGLSVEAWFPLAGHPSDGESP